MKRALVGILLGTAILVSCTPKEPSPSPTAPPVTSPPSSGDTQTDVTKNAIGSTKVKQGGTYWAVYVAVGKGSSPEMHLALAEIRSFGIPTVVAPVDCDKGATKALDLGPRDVGIAVYFKSEADAQAFGDSLSTPPAAIAKVRTFCAD